MAFHRIAAQLLNWTGLNWIPKWFSKFGNPVQLVHPLLLYIALSWIFRALYWMSTIILTLVKPAWWYFFFCITSAVLLQLLHNILHAKFIEGKKVVILRKKCIFLPSYHTLWWWFLSCRFLRALPWSNQGWRKGNLGPKGPSSFLPPQPHQRLNLVLWWLVGEFRQSCWVVYDACRLFSVFIHIRFLCYHLNSVFIIFLQMH